jgi:hypothetical protein
VDGWLLEQPTSGDYHTFRDTTIAFDTHVAEQDLGRLRLRDCLLEDELVLPDVEACTTRMSADPQAGPSTAE